MTPHKSHAQALYFVNAATDLACAGGFSIVLFFFLLASSKFFPHLVSLPALAALAAVGLWLFNWPHFAATNIRLYGNRSDTAQYPLTAYAVPFIILLFAAASLALQKEAAPFFIKLYLVWSPYHYSGQTYGVSLLYARRADWRVDLWQRRALIGFVNSTFLAQVAAFESKSAPQSFFGIYYPSLGLPVWVSDLFSLIMWFCAAAFAAQVFLEYRRSRAWPPLIYLVPPAAQFVWFIFGRKAPGYFEFIPLFHSVQYLIIAWAIQLKIRQEESFQAGSHRFVSKESIRWGLSTLLLGAVLFWLTPRALAAAGLPLIRIEPVVIAAINIHHFFVDGVIWKLKNPKVSSPLLTDLASLIQGNSAAAR